MNKILPIFIQSLPILLMIALIPMVANDYLLTALYVVIIAIALYIKLEKNDITILLFGFAIMIVFEYIFISTGVEKFVRNSLFGLMPLWLPFLWAYGFVAIKRGIKILEK